MIWKRSKKDVKKKKKKYIDEDHFKGPACPCGGSSIWKELDPDTAMCMNCGRPYSFEEEDI